MLGIVVYLTREKENICGETRLCTLTWNLNIVAVFSFFLKRCPSHVRAILLTFPLHSGRSDPLSSQPTTCAFQPTASQANNCPLWGLPLLYMYSVVYLSHILHADHCMTLVQAHSGSSQTGFHFQWVGALCVFSLLLRLTLSPHCFGLEENFHHCIVRSHMYVHCDNHSPSPWLLLQSVRDDTTCSKSLYMSHTEVHVGTLTDVDSGLVLMAWDK